jgi:hypothetical protein
LWDCRIGDPQFYASAWWTRRAFRSAEIVNDGSLNDGDSISYTFANNEGGCDTNTGATINPCTLHVGNPTAGVWSVTQAPEIDPASAGGGLALLLGGLAVMRGRRCQAESL